MAVVSKRRMQQQQQWSNRLKVGRVLLTVLSLFILAILLFRYDRQKNDTHYRKQLSSVSSSSSSYRSEPYLSPNHLLFFSSSSKKDAGGGGGGGAQLRGAAAKIETTETEETKVHEKQQSEKEEEEEQPHDKDESEGNNEETQEKKDIERKVIDNIIPQQEQLLPRPLKQEQPQPKQHNSSYRRIKLVLSNLKSSSTDSKTTTTTTTEGEIIFELHPEWAPIGVERVRTLLERHFYDQARFFRVLPKFVVQFGIAADPHVQKQWQHATLRDDDEEPNENADPDKNAVRIGNVRGTVTFAKTGKNSRTTQLFINTGNNSYLDRQGFAPIGTIVAGMEYVDRIQDEYREQPQQHLIVTHGNAYLQEHFPHLSYISSVQIMHDDDPLSEKESLSIVDPVM